MLKYRDASAGAIEGDPAAIGLWVHGDGTGNIPRLRFTDSTGQTFQPDGEPMSYSGWRYLVFPMDGSKSGRWGGAADGVIHYPIRIETIFLIDSASRQPTEGAIYISTPTLIYQE